MRRSFAFALLLASVAAPALAQTPPATVGDRYIPAPWWMRDPVIASVGQVRVEIQANRAFVSASFQSVDRSVTEASRAAADQVRALSQALSAYGADKVRVETSVTTQPIYDQYRDGDGVMRDNTRADRIARYQADASVRVTVRDVTLIERVYATIVASRPTSISQVNFNLEPENGWKANLQAEAMKDARRRAEAAATNAGATLGRVKIIDPSGRVCQTDVLAGWPSYAAGSGQETTVDEVVVTGSRVQRRMEYAAPPPPPAPAAGGPGPSETDIAAARLALQPPLQTLTDSACVIYGLN
ncbi:MULTISPECIES: SIMPL domain-containing protein [unclassified Brevundimonas]|uniref:SIMPL domain-containing protein n=1 Tax=unclassified Brevundimonas TaxID=2622653 RepID=UPI000E854113|nr:MULTISPECIES: SIMPL domain-containing protein [unclassified Brevundimonas]MCK6105841.1 SIMPL domain-containing protein [Brevundimonas sp. EYE_349]HBI18008.1 SIMPL domain-containing protein [Brevundimonas sp.]